MDFRELLKSKRWNYSTVARAIGTFFITIAKNVMDQEDLCKAIAIQQKTYSTEVAYNYFAAELQNVLLYVFNKKKELQKIGHDNTSQKQMLRNVIMTFAYREYLYQFFREI